MDELTGTLRQVDDLLARAAARAATGEVLAAADAERMLMLLQLAGSVQRLLDGLVTEATAQVLAREGESRDERLTTRSGCRDAAEMLRRTLRVDGSTARRYVSAGRSTMRETDLTSGALLPPHYERLHEALRSGVLSLSGYAACTRPFDACFSRLDPRDVARADALLADVAAGHDLDDPDAPPGPPPTVDELAALAHHITARLDPDGAEPEDIIAARKRHITLGPLRDGAVPLRGSLLPEVAAQLRRIFDSILNPRADEDTGVAFRPSTDDAPEADADTRTPAQKRHDAFATLLNVTAAGGGLPTIGGAAPTLVVSVTASDYARGDGRATVEGGGDVPLTVARHTACGGGVQRVLFDENGAIVGLSTSARIFTTLQRRAIALRDRECVIPGCRVPAAWCEVHHATEWSRGGPTTVGNGMLLCWHHHRTLETNGWQVGWGAGSPSRGGPAGWPRERRWRRPRIRHGADAGVATAMAGGP
ncbi:MAG: DUF222 domain-containing protein [Brachybacterium sp.]|nr:DUF222 domain-containing protein [Brachybacterium sp.]